MMAIGHLKIKKRESERKNIIKTFLRILLNQRDEQIIMQFKIC